MSTYPNNISTHAVFHRLTQRWLLPLAVGILGSVLGLFLSILFPARYEAKAVITLGVDYSRTEALDLVVEDRVLDRAWVLFTSPETMEETLARLQANYGIEAAWQDLASLREHVRLDGYFTRWQFIGVHEDPDRAAQIANAWRDVAFSRLEQAMDHAWKAASIQGVKFDVACVETIYGQPVEAIWQCYSFGPEVSQEVIDVLRSEVAASHGIAPVLSYEMGEAAQPPESATQWPRGLLVFSGGMLGLILGCVLAIASKGSDVQGSSTSGG